MTSESDRNTPLEIAATLSREVSALSFAPPVCHVYNPLDYAWSIHRKYLETYGVGPKRTLFVGMNPGPWGMAQTGVPFGEVFYVREWLGLSAPVNKPAEEHPARPVTGVDCPRSEVSGRRLWKLFSDRAQSAADFFSDTMVLNYCPLLFLEESGRNRTPDKLPSAEREPLFAACDRALLRFIYYYSPEYVIGVGAFAAGRVHRVIAAGGRLYSPQAGQSHSTRGMSGADAPAGPAVIQVLHPSPANPRANRDWAGEVARTLTDAGVWRDTSSG